MKYIRTEKGIPQHQMAKLLDTKQQVISKYENQDIALSLDRLAEIARVLGVTLDELVEVKKVLNNTQANSVKRFKETAGI